MAAKKTTAPKQPATPPAEIIMKGWAKALDAAVLERFNVVCETSLNIMTCDMVTIWPADLDVQSALMLRIYVEGWTKGMENALTKLEG